MLPVVSNYICIYASMRIEEYSIIILCYIVIYIKMRANKQAISEEICCELCT